MIHHSIAKKQGPKEGNSVRRVTRLAACLTAVSTLGAGLIMPITAVADDATPCGADDHDQCERQGGGQYSDG